MIEPRYLGDGIYVKEDEHGQMVLTTGSHLDGDAENRIVFGEHETKALLLWIAKLFP